MPPTTPGTARVLLDGAEVVGPVPARLFGSFVEHLGRAVHTGIHEPDHPTADDLGFRGDVLDLVRDLGVTLVRYPGGNFVSAHRWEDAVGPVEDRPVRLDPAWHSVEDHRVGLHELCAWARRAGVEVMYAVNLGTRGVQEAADVLEYANHPGGTTLSDRRRAHGAEEPFDLRLWCLGNEMDGPWQVGHKTAEEYGRLAAETARLMRMVDRRVELVVAGSSNDQMPTFGSWERTVLRHTAGLVDHLSVHAYTQELDGDLVGFLASGVGLERYLATVIGIADEVAAETGTAPVGIALDEWNVWDQRRWNEVEEPALWEAGWQAAPRLLEQVYDVADAVVVGSWLSVLLRHCDRVGVANLAQLVNVIAPIVTEPGGPAWRQTTYEPFRLVAATVGATALRPEVQAPTVATGPHGDVPVLDVAAVRADDGTTKVFLTHRGLDAALAVEVVLPAPHLATAVVLAVPDGGSRHTHHDATDDTRVVPRPHPVDPSGRTARLTLPPMSWTVLTLAPAPEETPR